MPEIKNLDQEVYPLKTEVEEKQEIKLKEAAEKQGLEPPPVIPVDEHKVRNLVINAVANVKGQVNFVVAMNIARKVREAKKNINLTEPETSIIQVAVSQQMAWPAWIKVGLLEIINPEKKPAVNVEESKEEKHKKS